MTTWMQKVRGHRAAKVTARRVRRVPVYDHTITRVVTNKLSGKARSETIGCRITPKRIELVSGEWFERRNGARIMPLTARVWSTYRHSVDLETLKRKTVSKPPEPVKKHR